MTCYRLSGYLSPAADPPTFVIPTFSLWGRNETFVQNLDHDGNVINFALVDVDLFYPVPVIPPHITLSESLPGLLAFWVEPTRVIVASTAHIRDAVENEQPSDPFAELELASLLDDEERVSQAAQQVAAALGHGVVAERWRNRELHFFCARRERPEKPKLPLSKEGTEKEILFQTLLNDPSKQEWPEYWNKLWKEAYKRDDLEQLALWWIELGRGQGEDGGSVISTLIRSFKDIRVIPYAADWLKSQDMGNRHWLSIWNHLYNSKRRPEDFIRITLDKLSDSSSNPAGYTWCSVWLRMWRGKHPRESLIRVAGERVSSGIGISALFIEYVVHPLLKAEVISDPLLSYAERWLDSKFLSTRVWADVYLGVLTYNNTVAFQELGKIWLRHFGGNMNRWHDVWQSLRKSMTRDEVFELGVEWLRRARWDLSTWPIIYTNLAALRLKPHQVQELLSLGTRWTDWYGVAVHKSQKIQQAMKYLKSREAG